MQAKLLRNNTFQKQQKQQQLQRPIPRTDRSVTRAAMSSSPSAQTTAQAIKLKAIALTPETFKPFGQVVGWSDDGKAFDGEDADLVLDKGKPRFYIMRLPKRGLKFHRITFHLQCTQCLGGLTPAGRWFMAVSAPTKSVEQYPKPEDLTVFEVPHGCFIKMHEGTWHAGPLFFESEFMDFYNLELSDTNVTDHNTHDYKKSNDGMEFEVVPL